MPSPRFSIVVPTRRRARTLAFALSTCLSQAFEDFEVVVSDNDSPPETREVVEACGDKRVKYVRTPGPLAMTNSWEFAVSHATGEYVTIIGDDDGFLPHALVEMDRLLRLTGAKVLRWESVLYNWPDIPRQEYSLPNTLLLPLRQLNGSHAICLYDSPPRIQAAVNGDISYSELPMSYCSAVHHSILGELQRKTGRVFQSRSPDIYSAFAVAHVAGRYYSLDAPLAIAGLSGKSTGIASLFVKEGNAVAADFKTLNDEAGITIPACVPDVSRMPAGIAESFVRAKAALFPDDASLALDRKRLVGDCLREAEADSEEEWRCFLAACRRSLADDLALTAWFDETHGGCAFESRPRLVRRQPQRRYGGAYISLDASEFGVTDVVGAALLCEKLLGYRRDGLSVRVVEGAAAPSSPQAELREKEAVIQALSQAAAERLGVIQVLRQAEGERLGVIQVLSQAAAERLGVIECLDRRVRELEAAEARSAQRVGELESLPRAAANRGPLPLLKKIVRRLTHRGSDQSAA